MESKNPDEITFGYIVAPWIDEQPNLAEEEKEDKKDE